LDRHKAGQGFASPLLIPDHPLALLAADKLKLYLQHQTDFRHNFGLDSKLDGKAIGKMFGVLVVENAAQELGYLAAFSGKLAGVNHLSKFVPPIYDGLQEGGFLNEGMTALTGIISEIKTLEHHKPYGYLKEVNRLKAKRTSHSQGLQRQLFDSYNFLNQLGESKSLYAVFEESNIVNPPAGAGECAAPKLLQYAFQHDYKPIAMAEFWWGISPSITLRTHGEYYPACTDKCAPLLKHMLKGVGMLE